MTADTTTVASASPNPTTTLPDRVGERMPAPTGPDVGACFTTTMPATTAMPCSSPVGARRRPDAGATSHGRDAGTLTGTKAAPNRFSAGSSPARCAHRAVSLGRAREIRLSAAAGAGAR